MSEPKTDRAGAAPADADLSRTYVLVLVVEAVVIAALFWLGRYFA